MRGENIPRKPMAVAGLIAQLALFALHAGWRFCEIPHARPSAATPRKLSMSGEVELPSSAFERYNQLRDILDGSFSEESLRALVRMILGYGGRPGLVAADRALMWQSEFPEGPDFSSDATEAYSWMEADIPDDLEQLDAMRVLLETLHGEQATKIALQNGDEQFQRRSTIVTWMVLTTSY